MPSVGNGIVGRANPSPVQLLQTLADQTYGPGVVGFIDLSIPGASLVSDLNGTTPSPSTLASRLAASPVHLDAVLVGDQINDQYVIGSTTAQYQANIQAAIATIVQYGAMPVYLEPNPISAPRPGYANYSAQIGQTNEMVYAAETAFQASNFPYLGNTLSWENYTSPPNAAPWNVLWMSSDGVHPNDAGYEVKASNYFNGVPTIYGTTNNLKNVINSLLSGINP